MKVIHSPVEMKAWSKDQHASGLKVCLVPTMGYFHEGHLSLMRSAAQQSDRVIVSLFVNPIQFGPEEDLESYPRNFEQDCLMASQEGVDVLFAPHASEMYPEGFQTTVSVGIITQHLCGASRPGHFDGVATVLTKLFHITEADSAVFGEKDYQQLTVIRRFVVDLNMDIAILGHPIVREKDGLAMSSRNSYLDAEQREAALCLYESLVMARKAAAEGIHDVPKLYNKICDLILARSGTRIDYVSFVDYRTLEKVNRVDEKTLLALAVKIHDRVRLIDNCMLLAEQ